MAEAELNVDELAVPALLATAAGIASALEGNANFPSPDPPPEELDRLAADLAEADRIYSEHRQRAVQAKATRDEIAERLRRALTEEVAYVQEASGGEIAKILSANLHVEEVAGFWPFNTIGQVEELTASSGDQPGEIDLAWDAVPGASGYEVEASTDPLGEVWEQSGATAQSKITIEQLDSHTRYRFRVRAIGERGAGDWSETVMKFAH